MNCRIFLFTNTYTRNVDCEVCFVGAETNICAHDHDKGTLKIIILIFVSPITAMCI